MSKIIVSSLTLNSSITCKCAYFYECCACAQALSCVRFFVIPWTVARQAPMSMECSRQEYWSGLPFSTPRDLPHPGIKPASLSPPAFAGTFFTTVPPGKPLCQNYKKWQCYLSFPGGSDGKVVSFCLCIHFDD